MYVKRCYRRLSRSYSEVGEHRAGPTNWSPPTQIGRIGTNANRGIRVRAQPPAKWFAAIGLLIQRPSYRLKRHACCGDLYRVLLLPVAEEILPTLRDADRR